MKHLGMRGCVELVRSPDRKNIRLAVKVSSDPVETLSWLLTELESKGPNAERVIIYCKSIKDWSQLYNDVFYHFLGEKTVHSATPEEKRHDRLFDMYHSETPDLIKLHIITSRRDESSNLKSSDSYVSTGHGCGHQRCPSCSELQSPTGSGVLYAGLRESRTGWHQFPFAHFISQEIA